MIHLRRITAHNFKQLRDLDLVLPEQGRILIQGLNEAGKSTLFEAVFFGLFGQGLATERGGRVLSDLIHYGAEEGLVELTLTLAGGRRLFISRRLRDGKPNIWALDVFDADGRVDEVRANKPVNARIEAELGFDAEALLNTCFVEQKKLEKLEGMGRLQREQSLMKLLNLDRLVELGERLKVRPADKRDLERLRDRRDLAKRQDERPRIESMLAEASQGLLRFDANQSTGDAIRRLGELDNLSAALLAAQEKASGLRERALLAEANAQGIRRWEAGVEARRRAAEAESLAQRASLAVAQAETARDALPPLVEKGRSLARLQKRLRWLTGLDERSERMAEALEAAEAEMMTLAKDMETLNEVRRALVEARSGGREAFDLERKLEQDLRAFEIREAAEEWRETLASGASSERDIDAEIAVLERRRGGLTQRARAYGLAGFLLLTPLIMLVRPLMDAGPEGIAGMSVPVLVVVVALLTLLAIGAMLRAWAAWRSKGELQLQTGRLQGEASVYAREQDRLEVRREAAGARLDSLQAIKPSTAERAAGLVTELDARLEGRNRRDVESGLNGARERKTRAEVDLERLIADEEQRMNALRGIDGAALGRKRETLSAQKDKLDAARLRRAPMIAGMAATLGLGQGEGEDEVGDAALDAGEPALDAALDSRLSDMLEEMRGEGRELQVVAKGLGGASASLDEAHARAQKESEQARGAWEDLPDGLERPAFAEADDASWSQAGADLRAAYEAAGGDALRQSLDAANREAASLSGQSESESRDLRARLSTLGTTLAELKPGLAPDTEIVLAATAPESAAEGARAVLVASLKAARDGLAPESAVERSVLVEARDQRQSDLNVNRHEIHRLERELGLAGQVIDLAEARQAHAKGERALAVRDRGASIVAMAGRNVVRRILPSTIQHMRGLLPLLTEQRYFDAQLDDDYRIEVYDDRAGSWKAKNIFSGGTRDQFSLALRLAFALATLPEERGAAPSFLFLDEPLGSFDRRRADALLDLLTEGEIARSFDQIFLISHVPVAAGRFDHCIVMEDGRVVESDL